MNQNLHSGEPKPTVAGNENIQGGTNKPRPATRVGAVVITGLGTTSCLMRLELREDAKWRLASR